MAVMAKHERKAISERTRAALQAAKRRGVRKDGKTPLKLGNPYGARALRRAKKGNAAAVEALKDGADKHAQDILPIIEDIRAGGILSLRAIAIELNKRAILTARGGRWHPTTVGNLLARIK